MNIWINTKESSGNEEGDLAVNLYDMTAKEFMLITEALSFAANKEKSGKYDRILTSFTQYAKKMNLGE